MEEILAKAPLRHISNKDNAVHCKIAYKLAKGPLRHIPSIDNAANCKKSV